MKNRTFSLLIPYFVDGATGLIQTAMAILAVQLGATALALGTISWVAQAVRLPICLTAGPLSERVGRKTLMLPAMLIYTAAAVLFTRAGAVSHLTVLYALILVSIGLFYPAFQAHIGDVSKRGELTKNLGMFNIGWCVGGGLMAVLAGFLVKHYLSFTFYLAGAGSAAAFLLVLVWTNGHKHEVTAEDAAQFAANDNPTLLFISRLGLFSGFFAYALVRILFPKMGLSQFGWSPSLVAFTVAALPIGQGIGMIATTASPWWRGKLWPQVLVQAVMLACAIVAVFASSQVLLMLSFLGMGCAVSVAYTSALYLGLSSRKDRGKNTGIHEALVAAGQIASSLLGGVMANLISPRAPYVVLIGLLVASLVVTAALSLRRSGAGLRVSS